MLHRDYLLEIIAKFVETVTVALRRAVTQHDETAVHEVEDGVAALLDLDPQTAMNLSPDSLVTMMLLSGMGDALASYVAFALDKAGDAYDDLGDARTAALRWDQAQAVAESFGVGDDVPEEFAALQTELDAAE